MKLIQLTQEYKAIVDDDDYERLMEHKWFAKVPANRNKVYAVRNGYGPHSSRKFTSMHRFILNAPSDKHVDHINGNGLDNRKSNLRLCTLYQNSLNRNTQVNNTSGYKGVTWWKLGKKWHAQIGVDGKNIHLGYFNNLEDAAEAYRQAAIKYHGEFANF